MTRVVARLFVPLVVIAGVTLGVAATASAAEVSARLDKAAHSGTASKYWHPCGMRDKARKVVRTYPRVNFSDFPGGKSNLRCGDKESGFRHIKLRHLQDWEKDALIVNENWRTHADWAISLVLRNPDLYRYNMTNNTYCFSRKVHLVYRGVTQEVRYVKVVIGVKNKNVITAFPSNSQCK